MPPRAMDMTAKIQKREAEAIRVPGVPSTKEFDAFAVQHELAHSDLDRSMMTLAESMEAEKLRVETCPDQHLFGEESVEKERSRGVENIANIRGIVELQDQVYRSIMSKVKETEEVPDRRHVQIQRSDTNPDPYQVEDGDTVRVQNACNVANQLVKRQVKKDLHQRRRQHIASDEAKYYDSLREKHKLVDEKAARSQQARVEKQAQSTFYAQQRRNEQQKMLKEIQRSQDHQFELLQLKHHPGAVSTSKLPALSSSASREPALPPGEPTKLNRHMSEPIYRDITNSHKLYSTTLERWRTFEADNERRTDAYWRKMLQGESRKAVVKPESKIHLFRNATKTITTIRTFMKRAAGSTAIPNAGDGTQEEGCDFLDAMDTTHMSEMSFDSGRLSPSNDGEALRQQYLRRLDSVKSFHGDLEKQARDKAERDHAKLEQKQRLGKAEQQKKAAKAGEYVAQWEQRSQISQQKRHELSIQNEGDCFVKDTAAQQRLDDRNSNQANQLNAMTESRSQKQLTIKADAEKNLDDAVKGFQAKQEDKDERGAELLDARMKMAYKRANSGYGDMVMQKMEEKKKHELEWRRKTAQEIKDKAERQAEVMKRVEKRPREITVRDQAQAMERLRLVRKDKGRDNPSRQPPPELSLPPELALPENLRLSPKSRGARPAILADVDQGSPASQRQDSPTGMDPPSPSKKPTGMDDLEQEMIHRAEKVIHRRSVDLTQIANAMKNIAPTSFLSRSGGMVGSSDAKLGASAGSSSRRSSNESDDEASEGEAQFLEDLRSKSGKWLTQMRKEKNS